MKYLQSSQLSHWGSLCYPKCTQNAYGKARFGWLRLDGTLALMHEPSLLQRGYLGSAQPHQGSGDGRLGTVRMLRGGAQTRLCSGHTPLLGGCGPRVALLVPVLQHTS